MKYHLMTNYGITYHEYMEMWRKQLGHCAICGILGKRLHIDHSHTTGKIRGLLCTNCNRGIGYFQDNPEFLRNAASYLADCS
jgi:hypothetical protein